MKPPIKYRITTNGISFRIEDFVPGPFYIGGYWRQYPTSHFNSLEEAQRAMDSLIERDNKTHEWREVKTQGDLT